MTISQVHFSSRSRSSILNFPAGQVPVVRKVDSVFHWINLYPLDSAIGFPNTYPLDGDLSGGQRYPRFEQPGPVDNFFFADKFFVSELLILITMVKI